MFRALCWKEWRQLRLLRWSGLGIGLLLPPFLLATAEAGERGWTVFGGIASYQAATVIQEALPKVMALAVLPLLALMAAAQAFAADRAAGTDAFLLQKPVPRSRIWQARAGAAIATTLILIASQVVIWWFYVRLLGNPAGFDESATLVQLLTLGGLGAAIALLAGAAAAAFVRSPMQAVLLGLVLIAVPVALGTLLVSWYGGYVIGHVPLGLGIPLFLLAGYIVSSFRMECRGEPAGRGRIRRGLIVMAAAIVAMPVFLAATAPVVMRYDAKLGLGNTTVYPAPSGQVAFVLNDWQRAGWLIDTASGERLRFFPRPVADAAWNDDGSRLAVIHAAGGSGRMLPTPRIEVFDPSGSPVGQPIRCDSCPNWWNNGVLWAGDKIVTTAFIEGGTGVLIVDPDSGERRAVPIPPPGSSAYWRLIKTGNGESVFVIRLVKPTGASEVKQAVLYRLDVEAGSFEGETTVPRVSSMYHAQHGLSPSGRNWLRLPSTNADQVEIVDLETTETLVLPARRAIWMADDRLVWIELDVEGDEAKLMLGRPGDARLIRSFPAKWYSLQGSPDGHKLLVTFRAPSAVGWVYDLDADRWFDLRAPTADMAWDSGSLQWAGPGSLAFVGQGFLALHDLAQPETFDFVIGRPPRS
jgi:ABC-type transport system involved in multi-copper enzyme maturation permease subunit